MKENNSIVNLTPHEIVVLNERGEKIFAVPPSGQIARVKVERVLSEYHFEAPCYRTKFGALEGLPAEEPGVMYLCSLLACQAAWALGRADVCSPGELTRDEKGLPVGCIGFTLPG